MGFARWFGGRNGTATKERIVDPGVVGIEDYFGSAETKAGMASAAARLETKGVIEESIYEDNPLARFESDTPIDVEGYEGQYEASLGVYTAVSAIAQKLSSVRIVAGRQQGKDFIDEPESPLQEFIDRPHPNLSRQEFVHTWAMFQELAGSELVVLNRQNDDPEDPRGPLVSLLPLRPSRVEIEPGGDFARWFEHRIDAAQSAVRIHPENACFTRNPNPGSDFWGLSKVSIVAREIAIDKDALRYNQSNLSKGGVPAVKIESDQPLTEALRRRIKRFWERMFGAPDSSGGVMVLSHGLKASPAGFPPKDMQFIELMGANIRRVIRPWKVPPVVAGLFEEASVLANADTQLRLFFTNAVIPAGAMLTNCLNLRMRSVPAVIVDGRVHQLAPRERWGFRFAFEDVDVLQDDDGPRKQEAREDFRAGVITLQEAREVQKLDELEGADRVRRFAEPSALPILVQGRIITPNEARVSLGLPELADGNELREPSIGDLLALQFQGQGGGSFLPRIPAIARHGEEHKRLGRANRARLLRTWLPQVLEDTRGALAEQKDRVLARFDVMEKGGPSTAWAKAKRQVRKGPFDDVVLNLLFPTDEEVERWRNKTAPGHMLAVLDSGSGKLESILDPDLQFALDEQHQRLRSYMDSVFASRVKDIQDSTRSALRKLLQDGFEESVRPFELKQRIASLWDEFQEGPSAGVRGDTVQTRAERIARTETHTALSKGSFEATVQATEKGANIVKSWLWSGIGRENHAALQSETSANPIPVLQRFSNGLLHPHEVGGDPSEIINCGCTTLETVVRGPIA